MMMILVLQIAFA